LLPLLCTFCLHAQNDVLQFGARAKGMGNASVTTTEPFALFNNIGAVAEIENTTLMVGLENRFGIAELNEMAIGGVFPLFGGVTGFSVSRFGTDFFSEQKLGIGYSNKFGLASLGLKINYQSVLAEGFETGRALVVEFGGRAEIIPQLFIGAHIYNLNRASLSNTEDELPTVLNLGISYQPHDKLNVNLQAEKDVDLNPTLKTGLEYFFFEQIAFRAGINTQPLKNFFGMGLYMTNFQIDYAVSLHQPLGAEHQLSLNYRIKGKRYEN